MNHIVGEIPVQLGKLFSLNKLILNFNQLSGGMPLELGSLAEIPRFVRKQTQELDSKKHRQLVEAMLLEFEQ